MVVVVVTGHDRWLLWSLVMNGGSCSGHWSGPVVVVVVVVVTGHDRWLWWSLVMSGGDHGDGIGSLFVTYYLDDSMTIFLNRNFAANA